MQQNRGFAQTQCAEHFGFAMVVVQLIVEDQRASA